MADTPLPLPTSRYRVHCDDPDFQVTWQGGSRFSFSGEVHLAPAATLEVETPDVALEVPLAPKSRPEHAVALLRRALPRHLHLGQRPLADGVEIAFVETLVPAAKPPRLRILSTDVAQRVVQLEDNKVEFVGATATDTLLTILCDGRHVTVQLGAGSPAPLTAVRVGANMPHGYRALVEGPVVSAWKDADFFSMVA